MKKTFLIALILFGFLPSCTNPKPETVEIFEFAVYENKPIFIDEYLYDKEFKKSVKMTFEKTEWYLLDWNDNGIYNEVGIDYFGVKSPFKNRPIISILKEENYLNHNRKSYIIDKKTNFRRLKKTELRQENPISYISNFIPIELTDGTVLEKEILKGYDKTVIYFWATWCAPCVKKLEKIELTKEKLIADNINFVPIYYMCSFNAVKELNEKKGLNFAPKEVSELSSLNYQISGLPETYVFDKNGLLIAETFAVE